jgi:hypothetical protein
VLPDDMQLRYDGVLVFQNKRNSANVADWRINDHVADTIVRRMMSRTTAVPGRMDNRGLADPRLGTINTHELLARAETYQFDFIISVRPYFIYEQHYWDGGYGLWGSSHLRSAQKHCAFSWITLEVWDVRRELIIGRSNGRNCDRDESIEVREQLSDYSAAEQATIERDIKRSLEQSVGYALVRSELFEQ